MRIIWKKLKKVLGIIFIASVLGLALYIMFIGLGLIEGLDFGAGAYYYADIPEFFKYVNGNHFKSAFPMWIHVALFLVWGYLMYRLWCWLDKKF